MNEIQNDKICPICKLENDNIEGRSIGRGSYLFNCPRCKNFIVTLEALTETKFQGPIPKLSAWIRDFNEKGIDNPQIYREALKKIPASLPEYNAREKQLRLLRNIERMTEYPGKAVLIVPEYDIPLAWASTQREFVYYMGSLIDRGLLRVIDTDPDNKINDMVFSVVITADGWDYLEKQEWRIEERTQAFVAMSFSEGLRTIWEGPIREAIKKAGYKPYRVDAEPHSDRIDFKIISEIKNSRFLIADVTEHKLGVYFEAGYALGLGLPVIWCVRKDHLEKVHFDTRQYNHIVWEAPDDLENKLYDFICAIIGKGKGT